MGKRRSREGKKEKAFCNVMRYERIKKKKTRMTSNKMNNEIIIIIIKKETFKIEKSIMSTIFR